MTNHEKLHDIPDKFYFNEMKREVSDLQTVDLSSSVLELSGYVDLDELGATLRESKGEGVHEPLSSMSDRLNEGLWNFTLDKFDEVLERRGYVVGDSRGQLIALGSSIANVAATVDHFKKHHIGIDEKVPFVNSLSSFYSMHMARAIVGNMGSERHMSTGFGRELSNIAYSNIKQTRERNSWTWGKVCLAFEMFNDTFVMYDTLTSIPEISTADAEMLSRYNEALAKSLEKLRTYTPKNAIGSLEGSDIETLFLDSDVFDSLLLSKNEVGAAAFVRLYNGGVGLTHSNARIDYAKAHGEGGGSLRRVEVEGDGANAPHADVVLIGDNMWMLKGGESMSKFCRELGLENQFELLKSMLLKQTFDLTVPVYVVDLADEQNKHLEQDPNFSPTADKLRRLIIARTRVMNVLGDDIHDAISAEISEDTTHTKELIKHKVVGHLRRIPEGYSPSAAAKELCIKELGVPIPDGHTYVRKHERGNVELPTRGHKLVSRNVESGLGRIAFH